ncbi:MAG: sugar nucleotide-binding protein [Bdellovibrio sp.]
MKPTGSIIRTSWLYSRFGNSFVKTIYNYASEKESLNVIYDQVETPTNGNPCVIRG